MIYRLKKELSASFLGGKSISAIYRNGKLIWEAITAFLFTKDGFGIQTKDGYIIKCKDQ